MDEYVYELCLYDSKGEFFDAPEIFGLFSEDYLQTAMQVIDNNITNLYRKRFDFITLDKVPLNSLYIRKSVEERYIYHYSDEGGYQLLAFLQGKRVVVAETENVVQRVLEGKYEGVLTISEAKGSEYQKSNPQSEVAES